MILLLYLFIHFF